MYKGVYHANGKTSEWTQGIEAVVVETAITEGTCCCTVNLNFIRLYPNLPWQESHAAAKATLSRRVHPRSHWWRLFIGRPQHHSPRLPGHGRLPEATWQASVFTHGLMTPENHLICTVHVFLKVPFVRMDSKLQIKLFHCLSLRNHDRHV